MQSIGCVTSVVSIRFAQGLSDNIAPQKTPMIGNVFIRILFVATVSVSPKLVATAQIMGSVGDGGMNQPSDVRIVQQRLNEVPEPSGGPTMRIDVDGIAGPHTVASIERFQYLQFGFSDGLIEPGRRTESRLVEFKDFADQDRPGEKIAWGNRVTRAFKVKLLSVAEEISVDPNHLIAAIAFESAESFSPAIKNAAGSGATGLIQFMPATAKGLGTSTTELAKMRAVDQLDFVAKHFMPYKGKCSTLSDVYMAILWPAAVGKPETYVLFDKTNNPMTYKQNRGLDANDDGLVTKQEATSKVDAKLAKGQQAGFKG